MKIKLLLIVSFLINSTGIAHALQMSNVSCNGNSGNINVTVQASKWDSVFHEEVTFKGYSYTSRQWKTVVKPLNHGSRRYTVDMMQEADLVDIDSFKIKTKKATIVVGSCV